MFRLSKLADYGLVVMACAAQSRQSRPLRTARDLAAESKLPLPTVSRLLKMLLQGKLLVSHRGNRGGYALAREPRNISLAEIISALEGPIAWTECSTGSAGTCELESCCSIKRNQRLISRVVRGALQKITLSQLIEPLTLATIQDAPGAIVPRIGITSGRIQ